MSDEHIIELIHFLRHWGVRSARFGGGGEPTLHTKLEETLKIAHDYGMSNSLVTNGTLFNKKLARDVATTCRYVGVSIDSATADTFRIGRKLDAFNQVIKNVEMLVKAARKQHCDVAYKFLIFSYNQHEIFQACELAKKLGVKDFHVRPADFRHQGMGEFKRSRNEFDLTLIQEQFEACHSLEDDSFRVFTVTHKFNEDLTPVRRFRQCYAEPLVIQVCADNNIYFCPDTRFMDEFLLGSHKNVKEIRKVWGGKRHKELVSKIAMKMCHSRCTYAPYNEACERLFINTDDPMCKDLV